MNRSWSLLAAGMLVMSSVASTVAASPAPSPAASATASSPDSTFGAAWQSVSCDELDINEKAAAIADCGYVTVPENRAAGTDSTIELGVVRLRSTSATPGAPVFIGTGGPGGPGLDFLSKENFAAGFDWTSIWAPVLADRDIVRFTQRGTQLAKPFLACPEYDAIDYQRAVEGWTREEIDAADRDRADGLPRPVRDGGRGLLRLQQRRERRGHRGHQGRPRLRHDHLLR